MKYLGPQQGVCVAEEVGNLTFIDQWPSNTFWTLSSGFKSMQTKSHLVWPSNLWFSISKYKEELNGFSEEAL